MAAKAELVRYIAAFSLLKPRPRGIKTVMFQRYDDVGGPAHGAERVRLLRKTLNDLGLAGFLIPRADEYQNEYVPPEAERLLWLTGFTGSAGLPPYSAAHGRAVRGRPLYAARPARQTDKATFESAADPRHRAGRLACGQPQKGDAAGLRSAAAHHPR